MRGKLTLTKNFGAKATIEEIKAMAQEIWNMSILYPKTPKKFCHNIKLGKIIMNSEVFCKKALLKNLSRKHLCWILFLAKMKAYRPANLLKRHYKADVYLTVIAKFLRTDILKNICERLLLRVLPFMLVWSFTCMSK